MANAKGHRMRARRAEEEATDWRHAYIGMEAAWKWSEEIIDTLVAALQNMVDSDDLTKEDYDQARAALAVAKRG